MPGENGFRRLLGRVAGAGGEGARLRAWLLLAAVGFLVLLTPFGREGTRPETFVAYRFLLLGIGTVCLLSLRRTPGPDFSMGFYAILAAVLGLMLLSVWLAPGRNAPGWTLWSQHALFAVFFIGTARFGARQSPAWKATLLGVLIGCALVHLGLHLSGAAAYLEVFVNPNYLATYLLVGFGSSLAVAFFGSSSAWRLGAVLSASALLYGITATASRGATLAAIGVIGLAALKHPKRGAVLAAGVLAVALVAGGALASPDLVRKFTDLGETDPYNYDRPRIWAGTLEMIGEAPLLGVGLSRFEHVSGRFRFPVDGVVGRYMKQINIAHSEYLQRAAESGLPAALLVTGLIAAYLLTLFRSGSGVEASLMPMERAAMLAGFGVALHALVDNVWTAPVAAAALATLALASSRLTAVRSLPYPLSGRGPAVAGVALALFFYSSSLAPGLAYHLNGSAQAHHARGRIEEAVSVQRLAVALRPNDALMLSNLGVYYKDLYVTNGDLKTLDAAGAYFLRAIEANPAFLAPRQERANQTLARLSGDPARDRPVQRELIETYEGMLELDPYLPFALRNLAEAHYWTGRADLAAQDLARAIEVEPNYVGAHLRLADWSEAAGDAGLAGRLRAEAQSIVERYPDAGNLNEYESLLLGARGPR